MGNQLMNEKEQTFEHQVKENSDRKGFQEHAAFQKASKGTPVQLKKSVNNSLIFHKELGKRVVLLVCDSY